jgi:hypothetical protein
MVAQQSILCCDGCKPAIVKYGNATVPGPNPYSPGVVFRDRADATGWYSVVLCEMSKAVLWLGVARKKK